MTAMLVGQDEAMGTPGPRDGGPRRRRAFRPAEKLDHLAGYEAACAAGGGGGAAYLRERGLYSWQITQWRQLRDAGMLAGRRPGERVGRLTPEQVEIARLARELESSRRRLATTEAALDIMGKAHALLEQISESADIAGQQHKR
jgi:transposase